MSCDVAEREVVPDERENECRGCQCSAGKRRDDRVGCRLEQAPATAECGVAPGQGGVDEQAEDEGEDGVTEERQRLRLPLADVFRRTFGHERAGDRLEDPVVEPSLQENVTTELEQVGD
jgi:hypothetical protein